MSVTLTKVALRREQDGTPTGHPAPTYFLCPCGEKIPAYDREGRVMSSDGNGILSCGKCGQRVDIEGYLLASRPRYHYWKGGAGFILSEGRQAIWETVTMGDMLAYLKEHGIRDVEYRRPEIVVIR